MVGLFMMALPEAETKRMESFSPTMFFLILLPPIIFESGYNLHKGNFFQNIGSIMVFAILGTAISALIVGGGKYFDFKTLNLIIIILKVFTYWVWQMLSTNLISSKVLLSDLSSRLWTQ